MKNKALSALESFIGEWEYTLYNCWFLESMDATVKGFTTIERLHDSFVVIRNSHADKKPDDIWVIGYSDPQEKYLDCTQSTGSPAGRVKRTPWLQNRLYYLVT
jgi:hypothetical protein